MDISAFEATGSGIGDESALEDVILLLDDDLQVPVKAVIAVVKHVGRLIIFVFALGLCVLIYCFTVSWVCMFWLQTRMLFIASSLLHHCLEDSAAPKHQSITLNQPVDAPKTNTSHVEDDSPPPHPRSTWAEQSAIDTQAIPFGAKSPERVESTFASGIELIQHMRRSSSGSEKSQASRKDSPVPQDDHEVEGEDVLDRLLQREREIQAEIGSPPSAQHNDIDQYAGAEEEALQQFEAPPPPANITDSFQAEVLDGTLSVVVDSVIDEGEQRGAVDKATNPLNFTTEQMAEAARFAADATRGGDKAKGKSQHRGHQQQRAAGNPQRKLSKEEQEVQVQSNWMASMTPGGTHARGVVKKEKVSEAQQSNRASNTSKPPVPAAARQKAVHMPLRQTTNGKTPQWIRMASMLGQNDDTPAQSPMTSAAASPAAKEIPPTPPHIRKLREAKAKKEAQETLASADTEIQPAAVTTTEIQVTHAAGERKGVSAANGHHSPDQSNRLPVGSAPMVKRFSQASDVITESGKSQAGDRIGTQIEEHVEEHGARHEEPTPADVKDDESEVISPLTTPPSNSVAEAVQADDEIKDKKVSTLTIGDDSGYKEWSQQYAQRSEPYCPLGERLSFYEETPDLKKPAPRSMVAELLKDMNTTPAPQTTGHDFQCESCHRFCVTSEDSKLCTPCLAVHDRMQDDEHAVLGELLTKPLIGSDDEEVALRREAPVPPTCDVSGMNDHETADCGVCPDCGLYADDEPCSRHAITSAVDEIVLKDHSADSSSLPPPTEPTPQPTQPELAAVRQVDENETPIPSARREATPADLIELKSSGEPRYSPSAAPQAKPSRWRPRAPSFVAPTTKSNTIDYPTESTARPFGSLPHSTFANHSGSAVDPFAAGPFQTDWWANKQAAMGLCPRIPQGMPPAPSSLFNQPDIPQQQYEIESGPIFRREGTSSLYSRKQQPEELTNEVMKPNILKRIMPPGLGGPQPSRQASFDALVAPSDAPKQKQPPAFDQQIKGTQLKMRQLAGLEELSDTSKVPEAFARKIVDPSTSISTTIETIGEDPERIPEIYTATDAGDSTSPMATTASAAGEQDIMSEPVESAISAGLEDVPLPRRVDPETEKAREARKLVKRLRAARETQEKQVQGAVLIPDEFAKVSKINEHLQQLEELGYDENGEKKPESTDTGESSGSGDTKSAKQALRGKKKAAREAVKVAWVERDLARVRVHGTWSIERADELKAATILYNERRAELASLMADGHLHDDDAKAYPAFADIDLSEPKHKPEGNVQLRRHIKAQQASSPSSDDDAQASNATSAPPAPDAEVQKLKAKLITARTLKRQALDYFKQPQPQSNIKYDTWKATGDAKVARATAFYRKKREELIAAFPNTGLLADLEEDFPEVS